MITCLDCARNKAHGQCKGGPCQCLTCAWFRAWKYTEEWAAADIAEIEAKIALEKENRPAWKPTVCPIVHNHPQQCGADQDGNFPDGVYYEYLATGSQADLMEIVSRVDKSMGDLVAQDIRDHLARKQSACTVGHVATAMDANGFCRDCRAMQDVRPVKAEKPGKVESTSRTFVVTLGSFRFWFAFWIVVWVIHILASLH